MNLLIACFLILVALYAYFLLFFRRVQPVPAVSPTVYFENLVPTAGGEEEDELLFEEDKPSQNPQLVEDAETVLLFESERLLNEVDAIVRTNHDVYAKLQLVLPNYGMFITTEYYEMINKYITLTLKEDCAIELNQAELDALWV